MEATTEKRICWLQRMVNETGVPGCEIGLQVRQREDGVLQYRPTLAHYHPGDMDPSVEFSVWMSWELAVEWLDSKTHGNGLDDTRLYDSRGIRLQCCLKMHSDHIMLNTFLRMYDAGIEPGKVLELWQDHVGHSHLTVRKEAQVK